ncbi:MAG: alkaline phosphatase [Bacteroidetes bacterium]|nr:alkaline phosphatase [Bacteroidota bacterium]
MKKIIIISLAVAMLTGMVQAQKNPRNVIFLIGDGMGLAQVYAGMVSNGNKLQLERFKNIGFSKTYSASNFTTDSGAGGTALACGVKTKNGMIGMTPDSVSVPSILELASRNGLSTGIVVACALTHATPASYIAHQPNRGMYEAIATDYLNTNIDVMIGGGRKHFERRSDERNLTSELRAKNYQVAYTIDEVKNTKAGKLVGLLYEEQNPSVPERGDMLPDATMAAINILDNNKKGFFLMVEGSQIDWACHDNNTEQTVREVLDFDKVLGRVLDYAEKNGNTLVIVTADHETGGMTFPDGDIRNKTLKAEFSTKGHTGTPVPVYAFGPGADKFTGFMENTSFKEKIEKLLKIKK